jgi:protein-tyrosine kinase
MQNKTSSSDTETMHAAFSILEVPLTVRPESRLVARHQEVGALATEQFRLLYGYLLQQQSRGALKRVAIASAWHGEGKTHVATNLGLTIGGDGDRKILLIDLDTRKPDVHQVLGIPNDHGLTDVLRNGQDLFSAIRKIEGTSLYVITAGKATDQGLTTSQMGSLKEFLEQVSGSFDLVLLDCPPLLLVADAPQLVRFSDAALLVLRTHKTTKDALNKAKGLLQGQPILGTVLAGVDPNAPFYTQYYKEYRRYSQSRPKTPTDMTGLASTLEPPPAPSVGDLVVHSEAAGQTSVSLTNNTPDLNQTFIASELAVPLHRRLSLLVALVSIVALLGAGLLWRLRGASAAIPSAKPPVASQPDPILGFGKQASGQHVVGPAAQSLPAVTPAGFTLLTAVQQRSTPGSSTVVLDLQRAVSFHAYRLTHPDRIYFDLQNTQLVPPLLGHAFNVKDPYLSRVRMAEPQPGVTRVTLQTNGPMKYTATLSAHPPQLTVVLFTHNPAKVAESRAINNPVSLR